MSKRINIVIDTGATFSKEYTNASLGLNLDFSDYDLTAQLRKHPESNSYVSFTCNGYSNGVFAISLTANQTSNMVSGQYVYDVYGDDGTEKKRLVEGIATLTPQVTK